MRIRGLHERMSQRRECVAEAANQAGNDAGNDPGTKAGQQARNQATGIGHRGPGGHAGCGAGRMLGRVAPFGNGGGPWRHSTDGFRSGSDQFYWSGAFRRR